MSHSTMSLTIRLAAFNEDCIRGDTSFDGFEIFQTGFLYSILFGLRHVYDGCNYVDLSRNCPIVIIASSQNQENFPRTGFLQSIDSESS